MAVEIVPLANRPALRLEHNLDALLMLLLIVAGICLLTSVLTKNYGFRWHCYNLRAVTAFDFIATFFVLVSLVRTFQIPNEQVHGSIDM